MKMIDLVLMTNKKRLVFSILSLAIAGITVVFSIFFIASVRNMISDSLSITENEYYLNIDETRYIDTNINYYQRLKESFTEVVPFVTTVDPITEFDVIGTDTSTNKVLLKQKIYTYNIIVENEYSSSLPNIIISEDAYTSLNYSNTINFNNQDFYIAKVVSIISDDDYNFFTILPLDLYAEYIDNGISINSNGSQKYLVEFYYIYSEMGETSTRLIIEGIYSDFTDDYVISYISELNQSLNEFSVVYQLPIIFFTLISIISFFNMNITIKLLIKDRKRIIKTLYIVGMKFTDLTKILLGEIALVSLISSVISILIGIIISVVIISFYSNLNVVIPRMDYILYLMISLIIIPIVQSFISILSMRQKSIRKLITI
jgi:ABC-type antimicrobial peptide transport system permease subunit